MAHDTVVQINRKNPNILEARCVRCGPLMTFDITSGIFKKEMRKLMSDYADLHAKHPGRAPKIKPDKVKKAGK